MEALTGVSCWRPGAAYSVILLPTDQRRPDAERKAAVAWAVVATPVTLAIDAVLIPVGFVQRLIIGD